MLVFKKELYNNLSVQPQLTNLLNLILKNLIMRRNYYLLFTVFAFLAFFSYSCVDEDFFSTTHRHEFNDFSLEEAKTYFRERSENQLSRSDGSDENLPLSPGDFVPLWDGAVPSVMNGLACYDIPISETSSYHAIISEEHNGTITARQVKVYQKLVILKNLNDGMMSQYILSLIPSKSYELQKGKQIPELFTTRGDKGGFSGIAIYSCLYTGVTARVDTYNKGRKVNGVFLLDTKNHEELNSKIETAKELLCMLSLQKRKKILSRGESDYGYDIDGGWLDEVIITPEEPWDGVGADGMTNEEWLENTRPDGNVDPQPEPEPEPELPEEDYSQVEEEPVEKNEPEISGFNTEEEAKVKAAIDNLKGKLSDINWKDINIKKGNNEEGRTANAKIEKNGDIIFFNQYFKYESFIDNASILYHEICHLQNKDYLKDYEGIQIEAEINKPNEDLQKSIRDNIIESLEKEGGIIDEKLINAIFDAEFIIDRIVTDKEFYINELKAYEEEKKLYPDSEISDKYKYDRDYTEWLYKEKLNYLENNIK